MPWFPDFVSAVELSRRQTQAAGRSDPVASYLRALQLGDARDLRAVWPGEIVIHDPRAGDIRGHRHLRQFVRDNQSLWAQRHTTIETVASTSVGNRAVVELRAQLKDAEGREVVWPLAVVAESADDLSVEFRTYCSQQPVDGRRHLRPPILERSDASPGDVITRYLVALEAGDTEAIVRTFAADGYLREPYGPSSTHRGTPELDAFFTGCFDAGGGILLEQCALTDDGTRCALEYNCLRWGTHTLAPQAGLAVFERDSAGLLTAARIYDDVEPPTGWS
jgi:ketosteroid isomerase-like protein